MDQEPHPTPLDGPPALPARVRLVVLFGGRSAEHEVSCVSAASVLGAVDPTRYDVTPVGITSDGRWVLAEGARAALAAGAAALPRALVAEGPELDPLPTLAAPAGTAGAAGTAGTAPSPAPAGVAPTAPAGATGPVGTADDAPVVVLPLLHGPHGEDGTVQGLLELAGVPYVGAGVLGSAVCMDKAVAKELLAGAGVPQVRWLAVRDVDVGEDLVGRVDGALGWPVFVKPANLGSSVGVTRVDGPAGLPAAVDLARSYDEWIVIEEGVRAREIECAVLGGTRLAASVPGEILPSREFYDYEDKYSGAGAELVIPADLPPDVAAAIRALAVRAAGVLRVDGMARVDFFYEEGGRGVLVNEVNTIPGFTPFSMYPQLWAASGVPYGELVDRLVALALERHRRRADRVGRGRT